MPIQTRILPNSLPKAGTHLLLNVLRAIPDLHVRNDFIPNGSWLAGHHDRASWPSSLLVDVDIPHYESLSQVEALFASMKGGESLIGAHVVYSKPLSNLIVKYNLEHLLIIRDPRDIVVSQTHFIAKGANHPFGDYYRSLKSFEERLLFSITGGPPAMTGVPFQYASIGQRLACMLPWFATDYTCVIRYEDLIGPAGGGSAERQFRAVAAIFRQIGLPQEHSLIQRVADTVYSAKADTFRTGQMAEWMREFSPSHKEAFKESAGAMLIEYGYEKDFDW